MCLRQSKCLRSASCESFKSHRMLCSQSVSSSGHVWHYFPLPVRIHVVFTAPLAFRSGAVLPLVSSVVYLHLVSSSIYAQVLRLSALILFRDSMWMYLAKRLLVFVGSNRASIGKGTQGVMRLHGFKGFPASHGATKVHRAPGSIGQGGVSCGEVCCLFFPP